MVRHRGAVRGRRGGDQTTKRKRRKKRKCAGRQRSEHQPRHRKGAKASRRLHRKRRRTKKNEELRQMEEEERSMATCRAFEAHETSGQRQERMKWKAVGLRRSVEEPPGLRSCSLLPQAWPTFPIHIKQFHHHLQSIFESNHLNVPRRIQAHMDSSQEEAELAAPPSCLDSFDIYRGPSSSSFLLAR